ncbi:polypyrimidine tract-binding protein 3 [Podargus strigoides]
MDGLVPAAAGLPQGSGLHGAAGGDRSPGGRRSPEGFTWRRLGRGEARPLGAGTEGHIPRPRQRERSGARGELGVGPRLFRRSRARSGGVAACRLARYWWKEGSSRCRPGAEARWRLRVRNAFLETLLKAFNTWSVVTVIKFTRYVVLRSDGVYTAFLEMASQESAVAMMSYYTPAAPHLIHQPVYFQYSNDRALKTVNLPNQAGSQPAWQGVNAMQSRSMAARSVLAAEGGLCPGSVLRITVENLLYPVTLDTLYQIFSKFGSVLKIIIFTRNNQFQALLQYAEPAHAYYAKMTLNGQSIYGLCCTLRIDFSKLTSLKVKYNNDKSRDFTRFDLPSGQSPVEPSAAAFGTPNIIFSSHAGGVGIAPATGFAQGAGLMVPPVPGAPSPFAVTASVPSRRPTTPVTGVPRNTVLLVNNLNPDAITPHGLFILFGVYGDVQRVKIMFKKKDSALVQMADSIQAQIAISYLSGQRLYGKVLHATLSKHVMVYLPYGGQGDQGLTKDYSDSPLHRFKKPGSKNFKNIFPPSDTLHLSNIPTSVTVDDLKKLFKSMGHSVKAFRFFQDDCTMALIQLASVEEALHAIIELHDHDLGQNHHLQVTFSKSRIFFL